MAKIKSIKNWEVWEWNGRYIKGTFLKEFSDRKEAVKFAKQKTKYKKLNNVSRTETNLEDEAGNPIGIIIGVG